MFTLDNETRNSNILEVRVKNYEECGYCSDVKNKVILNIPWAIWSQWMYVSRKMGSKEWGGVFWIKDNAITHFKIPKQEVGSSECEFKEELGGDGIVHSHHDMGAFHSSQDNHHARNLYEYSIVLSNGKGYEATRRIKLPCGGFGYVEVELHLVDIPDIEISKIAEKKQEFLQEKSRENQYQQELGFGYETPCDKCVSHNCDKCRIQPHDADVPCYRCESFKCKSCRFANGRGIEGMFPFCDCCEDYDFCRACEKLAGYLENYPQERKEFEYLYANQL
jgi:hypothetical protein